MENMKNIMKLLGAKIVRIMNVDGKTALILDNKSIIKVDHDGILITDIEKETFLIRLHTKREELTNNIDFLRRDLHEIELAVENIAFGAFDEE